MYLGGEGAPQKASVCVGQFIRRTAAAPRRYTIIAAGSNLISNEDITAGIRQGHPDSVTVSASVETRPIYDACSVGDHTGHCEGTCSTERELYEGICGPDTGSLRV